jgi:choline dehydrogenase
VINKSYDYIIVGAGSAGCTLAYRLGANPHMKILVIEAGGSDRSPIVQIPLTWGLILKKRLFDWNYFTQKEDMLSQRNIECARGKLIGGCSSINGMAYARGAPEDYDGWRDDFGLTDWSYEKVLPYFIKSESWQGPTNELRGLNGPLTVTQMHYEDPLMESFFSAVEQMGYEHIEDYNASRLDGFSHMQTTIKNGKRWSASSAYLYPAIARGNVDVLKNAMVHKVKFVKGTAIGVEVQTQKQSIFISASQEVILSAGVINSPQLLMLSGVGNAKHLERCSIKPVIDLPGVGENLHDHMVCDVRWKRKGNGPLFNVLRWDKILMDLIKTQLFGKGLSAQVPAAAVGHVRSRQDLVSPDLQLILAAAPMTAAPHFEPWIKAYVDAYALKGVYLTPKSRGRVLLRDAQLSSSPLIYQNFLQADEDRIAMRAMIKLMREIGNQKSLQKFCDGEIFPGPNIQSDLEIDEFIAKNTITLHHPVGTCRMGMDDDPMAVINSNMQVRGISRLRVVDGSAMPRVIRGPVNAPIMMMAEKISDQILKSL